MREIKFQVFTEDWKGVKKCFDCYYLYLLEEIPLSFGTPKDGRWYKVAFTNSEGDKETVVVDRDKIRMFTGLTDKNGKEIYEGDIVRIKGHALQRDKSGIGIDIDGNYVVKWSEKMELILSVSLEDDDGWLLNRNVHYTEVIGNIYENPHLIGGKHG